MDRKSRILFWFLIALIVLSLSATFYKTVSLNDFEYYESETEEETVTDDAEVSL